MAQSTPPQKQTSAAAFVAWVWAGLLIAGGLGFLAVNTGLITLRTPILLVFIGATAALALPFIARWLTHREEWWAALTAWVFSAMTVIMLVIFIGLPYDQITGAVMVLTVLPPLVGVYLHDRKRWWMLIPIYVIAMLSALIMLTILPLSLETLGAVGLLFAALPFWIAYMKNRMLWWALIPAGTFSIGAIVLLGAMTLFTPGTTSFYVILHLALAAVSMGVYVTFKQFDWAIWLAIGFVLGATLAIWFPSGASFAVVALTLGFYIAFKQIDAKQKAKHASKASGAPSGASPQQSPPPAQAQTPAPTAQPTPPPAAPNPPSTQAPARMPTTGMKVDAEATAGMQARQEPAEETPKPVVEFRPLDPFKQRKEQPEEDED